MIGAIALGFAEPLVLVGLLTLPVLWWLLRLIPPRPRRVNFPPTRLLLEVAPKEETPARAPWWLTLLRLALAALVIIAAAGPQWNPPVAAMNSNAPIALMVDDGWTAASSWDARLHTADDILARAENDHRPVALIPLSEGTHDISFAPAASARVRLHQMAPKPYTLDRAEALPAINRFFANVRDVEVVWLSDGVDLGRGADFVKNLAPTIGTHPMTIVTGGIPEPLALAAADNAAGALTVKVLRAASGGPDTGTVRALDLKGLTLGEAPFAFKAAADRDTDARFELPVEIRNDIARLEISGERSSGAVQLLDKRSNRRTVGIVSGATTDTSQPLLSSSYYITRALGPFADVRLAQGESPADAVGHFLDQNLPMLILADVGNVAGDAHDRLARWIEDGGVLVRFAGPRLAASDDDLVPVRLRRGGRILGGSLSWDKPQPLAGFSRESPFAGLTVPNDVTVSRQVLAEPDAALTENTWATLADGTPLVTAARRGKGLIVLFHVTGDTRWSDLPLSGAFVDMLKRIVALASTAAVTQTANAETKNVHEVASPLRVLDGFGNFGPPPSTARPVPTDFSGSANAEHPPGFYGPPDGPIAVNTLAAADRMTPLDFSALARANREIYRKTEPRDLRGPILLAALALFLLDSLIVLYLNGSFTRLIPRLARASAAVVIIGGAVALTIPRSGAEDTLNNVPRAALETKLAYVVTGNQEADSVSKAGLGGLTLFLAQRTALEAGEPVGLDIAKDELAFYPLIYWPIVPGAAPPSNQALKRIDSYMKQGGTVLFDTRDAVVAPPGPGGTSRSAGMLELRKILSSLDIPELEPVPRDHVLTKTFYLLRDFPGRFATGQLWVEALPAVSDDDEASGRPARGGDGVSSILITSNDLAGAWAMQPDGQPMLPMVEGEPRQRELAFRAGVNIVMYTLTGNYKADQVHVPALLERLGQ
jgi:Domain of unknown function (DUF4159)/Aerotolerance regulator N-terminal